MKTSKLSERIGSKNLGLELELYRNFLDDAHQHFERLQTEIAWAQGDIQVFGKQHPVPRLEAWYADPDCTYSYSRRRLDPLPWTNHLLELRQKCSDVLRMPFNSVLLNRYRDGKDGMGWHADNESELGVAPAIASLSLGATRRFRLRRKDRRHAGMTIELGDGDLLLMRGETQQYWEHCVTRTATSVSERINATFRLILGGDRQRNDS